MSDQTSRQSLFFRRIADDLDNQSAKNAFSLGKAILDAASRILSEGGVELEALIAAARDAYNQYVAPIDLPLVPNLVEPAIDALIWQAIETGIRALAARTVTPSE